MCVKVLHNNMKLGYETHYKLVHRISEDTKLLKTISNIEKSDIIVNTMQTRDKNTKKANITIKTESLSEIDAAYAYRLVRESYVNETKKYPYVKFALVKRNKEENNISLNLLVSEDLLSM